LSDAGPTRSFPGTGPLPGYQFGSVANFVLRKLIVFFRHNYPAAASA